MSPEEWRVKCDMVTEKMQAYTRPFVTLLGTPTANKERLIGSGSYIELAGQRLLLTCKHVVDKAMPTDAKMVDHYLCGLKTRSTYSGVWRECPSPKDVASASITDAWQSESHGAKLVAYCKFDKRHQPSRAEEILFFGGYAGENSEYIDGILIANGTGYSSQEVKDSGDSQVFEMFWEPEKMEYSSGTSVEARAAVRTNNPQGFSGSLVWNTRYMEVTSSGAEWTPDCAVVTGLLRRWDPETKRLLAWRVEHLREWLVADISA